jgi:predicted DNA-binding protein (UPF0251 family)
VHLYLTDTEVLTLRDVLRTAGLNDRQIEDITLLLSFKRERVQLAFYYRVQGMTFEQVGERVGVSRQVATRMLYEECENIADFLRCRGAFL